MGYGSYFRDGMQRGYGVPCKCHKRGCKEKIDRGMGYLCYSCTYYFCGKHLVYGEKEHECFAGESNQICEKCLKNEELFKD